MGRKSSNDSLLGFVAIGAALFLLGRCSADGPKSVNETAPVALVAPSEAEEVLAPAAAAVQPETEPTKAEPVPEGEPVRAISMSDLTEDDGPSCGSKRYCREMNSCEEAYHYLNQCGLSRIDGDGDGVPCESIC